MKVFMDSKTADSSQRWICTVGFFAAVFLTSGCSVYKSNGRKTFEERAPANINRAQALTKIESPDTCWTQPAREPIWELPENEDLRVKSINHELIEVCLVSYN